MRTWTRSYFWPLAILVLLTAAIMSWLVWRQPHVLGIPQQ